jgi:quinol monooxygenase YgiN
MTRSQLIFTAKRGKRGELLDELDRLEVFIAVREQPGFLSASVLVPDDNADRVLLEGSWASPEHFERWRESPSRVELLRSVRHLLADEPDVIVYQIVDTIS